MSDVSTSEINVLIEPTNLVKQKKGRRSHFTPEEKAERKREAQAKYYAKNREAMIRYNVEKKATERIEQRRAEACIVDGPVKAGRKSRSLSPKIKDESNNYS